MKPLAPGRHIPETECHNLSPPCISDESRLFQMNHDRGKKEIGLMIDEAVLDMRESCDGNWGSSGKRLLFFRWPIRVSLN